MKTVVKLLDDMTFIGKTNSNHLVPMDTSPKVGGGSAASSPLELLLVGLGGCTGMDVISMLKKRKKIVDKFELEISAERADEHPKLFTKIHIIYKLSGKDLTGSEVERAINLSKTKYCSVSAMLGKSANITYEYQINP